MKDVGLWHFGLVLFTFIAVCLSFELYAFGITEAIFRVVVPNCIMAVAMLHVLCAAD